MKSLNFAIYLFLLFVVTTCATHKESPRTILESGHVSMQNSTDEDLSFSFEGGRNNSRMLTPRTTEPVEVLSRLKATENHVTLSRNGTIAFVVQGSAGLFQILDVSNPASLRTISSLKLKPAFLKIAVISSDEKLLYSCGWGIIEIVNITNLYSPTLLGSFEYPLRFNDGGIFQMVVTTDGNRAVMSFGSLEIFDFSDPKSIKRLYTVIDGAPRSICLLKDDKTLLIGSGQRIDVFDISNPSSPTKKNSVSLNLPGSYILKSYGSLILTRDQKTAYYGTSGLGSGAYQTLITTLDLRDMDRGYAPRVSASDYISRESREQPGILLSPNESYMYLYSDFSLRIRDLSNGGISKTLPYQLGMIVFLAISPDNKIGYLSTTTDLIVVKLFVDVPLTYGLMYKFVSNEKARYSYTSGSVRRLVLASNQTKFYQSVGERLYSFDFSSSLQNPQRNEFHAGQYLYDFQLWKNESIIIYKTPDRIGIVTSAGLNTLSSIYKTSETYFLDSRVCPNENSLYVLEEITPSLFLTTYDISSIESPKRLKSVKVEDRLFGTGSRISPDCKTLFFYVGNLSIFDISNPESPVHLSSLFEYQKFLDITFSHKGSFGFLRNSAADSASLTIIDFSDRRNVKVLSQLPLPYSPWDGREQTIIISEDDKTLLAVCMAGLIGVDISDLSNPIINFTIEDEEISAVQLSKDKKTLFLGYLNGTVFMKNFFPQNNLYFPKQNFSLGGVYSNNLQVLAANPRGNYDPFAKPYKFSKMSLLKQSSIPQQTKIVLTYSALPSWMYFDKENGDLTVEPRLDSHLGSFAVSTVISTEVSAAAFQTLPKVDDSGTPSYYDKMSETDAKNLLVALISIGYIDSESFLTSNFNPGQTLRLSPKYERIEAKIREILSKSSLEFFNRFMIVPSLVLSKTRPLEIQTFFPNSLSLVITLNHNGTEKKPNAQFVSKIYSGVLGTNTNQKTKLTLDGSLVDINTALREIAINLTNSSSPCDGKIMISDGFNPTITQEISNTSKYFLINEAPIENKDNTIKSQISRYNFVKGEYFMIELSANSFSDANQENLEYLLKLPNSDKKIPAWMSQYGLQITGTVPEEVLTSSIDLVLVAKNEFRSTEVPFKMQFHVSSFFVLKLLMKYGGYLFSVITLYIILNQILNILGAKYYRHPKRFVIPVGHPISPGRIYPIFFAAEELKMAAHVQEKLFKKIAEAMGKSSLKDSELVSYFAKENNISIDEGKIWDRVKKVVSSLDLQNHGDLKYTAKRINSCLNMICKLIFYNLVSKKLDLSEEKETKAVFDSISKDWAELIDCTSTFEVNNFKLMRKLPSSSLRGKGNQIELIDLKKFNVNLELLKHAIAGEAFKYHLMDLRISDININIMEKVHRNSPWMKIKKLLKKDEETLPTNERGKAIYGVEYSIKENTLIFHGVPEHIFAGRVLAVQIVTRKGRILRELNILGCEVAPLFGNVAEAL